MECIEEEDEAEGCCRFRCVACCSFCLVFPAYKHMRFSEEAEGGKEEEEKEDENGGSGRSCVCGCVRACVAERDFTNDGETGNVGLPTGVSSNGGGGNFFDDLEVKSGDENGVANLGC